MPLVTFHWFPVSGKLVKRHSIDGQVVWMSSLVKTRTQFLESLRYYLDTGVNVTVEVFV